MTSRRNIHVAWRRHWRLRSRGRDAGFTLIELLASIAILSVIVVMIAAIFSESDKAWNQGTGRAYNSTEGRAALNLMARDLEVAVADNILTFMMRPDKNNLLTYGFTNSEISFVSMKNDSADGNRTAREIQYWVNVGNLTGRYQLVRAEVSDAITNNPALHCYYNPLWFTNRFTGTSYGVVADNVVGLYFSAPQGGTNTATWFAGATNFPAQVVPMPSPQPQAWYFNMTNLPPYVDICLEIMNEREAKQLSVLGTTPAGRAFVERHARRHTARVFFQNRQGHKKR